MKNADRHKPCNFYVKGPNHRKTGVAFFVHLAPGGTVTSPTFHPWDPRWLSNCPHWLPIVILGFKIVIFSTFSHTSIPKKLLKNAQSAMRPNNQRTPETWQPLAIFSLTLWVVSGSKCKNTVSRLSAHSSGSVSSSILKGTEKGSFLPPGSLRNASQVVPGALLGVRSSKALKSSLPEHH